MAGRGLTRSSHRSAQCLLRLARDSEIDCSSIAQPAEPPDADPHVRWCGREVAARLLPIPIAFRAISSSIVAMVSGKCALTTLDAVAMPDPVIAAGVIVRRSALFIFHFELRAILGEEQNGLRPAFLRRGMHCGLAIIRRRD